MYLIKNSHKEQLPDIAECYIACFPGSLAARLGKAYVQKTLEWFILDPHRFLFHIEIKGKVAGFCGGFKPVRFGDGSSSGMLQNAFNYAVRGIILKPWLLFHPEVARQYPFLLLNIKRRITGKVKPIKPVDRSKVFKPYTGLVVIGVLPKSRGSGLAQMLMQEFETKAKALQQSELVLSVKKDNKRAIKAYTNFGWSIREENSGTYIMNKFI